MLYMRKAVRSVLKQVHPQPAPPWFLLKDQAIEHTTVIWPIRARGHFVMSIIGGKGAGKREGGR